MYVKGFGLDADGEIYLLAGTNLGPFRDSAGQGYSWAFRLVAVPEPGVVWFLILALTLWFGGIYRARPAKLQPGFLIMNCRVVLGICMTIFFCGIASPVRADVVSVVANKDNTLYESPTGALSNGAGDYFFSGRVGLGGGGLIRRGLIGFDISSAIPANATIETVSLKLFMSATVSGAQNIGLHRTLADWGEGESNAPLEEGQGASSLPGDATWIHTHFPGSFWTNIGGDFSASASATLSVNAIGSYVWSSTGMVNDVQSWLDNPGTNFGWVIRGEEGGFATAKRFDSRTNLILVNRPELIIQFSTIPEPGGGVVGLAALFAFATKTSRRPRVT